MTNYRIVEETSISGKKTYVIEKKYDTRYGLFVTENWAFCAAASTLEEAKEQLEKIAGREVVSKRIVYP